MGVLLLSPKTKLKPMLMRHHAVRAKRLLLLMIAVCATLTSWAQNAANPDQGGNGSENAPHAFEFQNGNLHGGNSHFLEHHSIPYRLTMSSLTVGQTYRVGIRFDALESGWVAIDYITNIENVTPHTY